MKTVSFTDHKQRLDIVALFLICQFISPFKSDAANQDKDPGINKVRDLVIYKNDHFYSSFPSVVRRPDGELIVAFRRAPERRSFGEKSTSHVDPNSYLVMVRSTDDAGTWTTEPELICAHPFGGSQDPCLLQLKNGTMLCMSYLWAFIRPDGMDNLKQPVSKNASGSVFMGGYYLRSEDGGKTWKGPFYPPPIPPEVNLDAFGNPLHAYNRGALFEGKDGRIFWVVAACDKLLPSKTSNYLLISEDSGTTWQYSCPVAVDDKVIFNESSAYQTVKGDIVAFIRTASFNDHACIARSTDGGKSFSRWQDMGFQGHPLHALRLTDNRVLLTYGYRHEPYGIRARILNRECTDFDTAPEFMIRVDGGSSDIGYPWAVQLNDSRVLVVYYFNVANGPRHIAGSILEIQPRSGKSGWSRD
jgi:sialidase-1